MGGGLTPDIKFGERVPILGSYLKFKGQNLGYLSPVFWRQNLGLPPWPPNMEVNPWVQFGFDKNFLSLRQKETKKLSLIRFWQLSKKWQKNLIPTVINDD